jgi:hypothetical protein
MSGVLARIAPSEGANDLKLHLDYLKLVYLPNMWFRLRFSIARKPPPASAQTKLTA